MSKQKAVLSEEQVKTRRGRSVALAVTLGVLVAMFYVITIVKLGPGIMDRPL
ncbi:hypothetical protein PsW64_00257 [Pseudovibrio sp. W64]|uniref:hypothetical protein n=1 Tax=unclassified Pseudovibrio TaxID=2627060 RepID=UPI0007B23B41|nr:MULTISPECIES: hypothetical protein [unclassified Pseudovibrio]KZK85158.1 hypothetical protein PsAD13_01693 [Pseudovibrio sp. Ad13]KZK90124.1 hypothetical protein PsAD5_04557 [Pseudovibrio sp. Ad5]KZK90692.1 hypothetical protein PsW64_00257 [Pseudovibrio sp. W64]KZK91420.1 hypothetical protein PsAD46_01644 [Pseudovibrio sp. Ad46]KZK94135.1 hypothetical protein PsW74_04795 [Pseudovibrio sp. W74]